MALEWIIRKAMQLYWRWQRPMTLGARAIVVDTEGKVLLVRQTYSRGWIFPGGGVEPRETIEIAVERELQEEAGIALTGPMELLGIYSNEAIFPGDHVAIYVVRGWRQARPFVSNAEIADARFFAIDDLPPDTTEGTRRRIQEMLGRVAKRAAW